MKDPNFWFGVSITCSAVSVVFALISLYFAFCGGN
jgi:hypothetical protein